MATTLYISPGDSETDSGGDTFTWGNIDDGDLVKVSGTTLVGIPPRQNTTLAPSATSVTAIHAGFAGNDASNAFPGPFTNPDVPRTLTVTFAAGWDGGTVNVVGTDENDAACNENFVPGAGTTVAGTTVFKTVTSATKGTQGAAADTASIGSGTTIGLIAGVSESAIESLWLLSATNGSITAILPTAAGFFTSLERKLVLKKTDATAYTITLDGFSTQTIDGASTYVLRAEGEVVTLIASSATAWRIV